MESWLASKMKIQRSAQNRWRRFGTFLLLSPALIINITVTYLVIAQICHLKGEAR
jgi:hypothetical protein